MDYERALVVFAHPDDAEFLCGGTIALWTEGGTEVDYVCATDGSAGRRCGSSGSWTARSKRTLTSDEPSPARCGGPALT
jgi:LmbE family N-acetylglucosaminyl deacetylase